MKDLFQYNAELTIKSIKQETGITLDYDESSVAWVDGYIERQRNRLDSDSAQMLISILGSFLGECIRKQFGGEWVERAEGWAICFNETNCVFPFNN
jgi:hypothetical protein